MLNEDLIAALENGLSQTRNAQNRLLRRLHEVEAEAESLRQEIQAMENSAAQSEQAIDSLLTTIGSGVKSLNRSKSAKPTQYEPKYEPAPEVVPERRVAPIRQTPPPGNYRSNLGSLSYINENQRNLPTIRNNIEPLTHRFADRTITQASTLLLREANRPLHVNDLYTQLVSGGFEFKGNNPTISIAVSLNRNRRFRKVAPGTFDLIMRDASQAAS
jgi:hypothetical protein